MKDSIEIFLETKAAKKLGIFSRDEFVKRACLAVLVKYKADYQMLFSLFEIDEETLKKVRVEDL